MMCRECAIGLDAGAGLQMTHEKKLSLFDAVSMAVGGMVGGGIFAVLGEAVSQSGNGAFVSLGIAGLLALITGISNSRLTLSFDAPGGSFLFVKRIIGLRSAGTVGWFLLLGYIFTISLYAYACGHYSAMLLGLAGNHSWALGCAVIAVFVVFNLLGVRESGVAESVLVYAKLIVLVLVIVSGAFLVTRREAAPIFEHSLLNTFAAAGLIFVAYEGFELLAFDYDDIQNNRVNFLRAIGISILIAMIVYMSIAFITTGMLSDQFILHHRDTVLAYVALPALGLAGFYAVLMAAVFATSSAINATLFAMARLANLIAEEHQLPLCITNWQSGGVPVVIVVFVAVVAAVFQSVSDLGRITLFASTVFLLIFSIVNLMALLHHSYKGLLRIIPVAGFLGCLASAAQLVVDRYFANRMEFRMMLMIAGLLIALRIIYIVWLSRFCQSDSRSSN